MDPAVRERLAERLELVASAAWLGMDYAWMEEHVPSALALAGLTCLGSLCAVPLSEPRVTPPAGALAVAAWALMNSLWMASDLGLCDALWLSRLCFWLGLSALGAVFVVERPSAGLLRELARRFSRLRGR